MSSETLTLLDIASGLVLPERVESSRGGRLAPTAVADGDSLETPRRALERAIMPALLRPPCLVSFSGGRDSAAVLAIASALARREGLPLPIPATNVFVAAPGADESRWQELLIRHLRLPEWLRLKHDDELDLIGPFAQRVLVRHGVLAPANLHFHLPLIDAASGGSLLTGVGGDELYAAARRVRGAAVLSRAAQPVKRDILSVGYALAPVRLRRKVILRRARLEISWLRTDALRRVALLMASEAAAEPWRLSERMTWWQQRRYVGMGARSLEMLGDENGVLVGNPLLSSTFWAAAGRAAGPAGFASRTEGVVRLFGDLLPREMASRHSKANFDDVFWARHSLKFARQWDGRGVPDEWVDRAMLAEHWRQGRPSAPSGLLLQLAWLASVRHSFEQAADCLTH